MSDYNSLYRWILAAFSVREALRIDDKLVEQWARSVQHPEWPGRGRN